MSDERNGVEKQAVAFSWERTTRLDDELQGYAQQLAASAPRHDAQPRDHSATGLR